nr:MAG TPA: hypothetical protein [Caudoviricetes sp.]
MFICFHNINPFYLLLCFNYIIHHFILSRAFY